MIMSPEGKGVFSWGILQSKKGGIECFWGETRFKTKRSSCLFHGLNFIYATNNINCSDKASIIYSSSRTTAMQFMN